MRQNNDGRKMRVLAWLLVFMVVVAAPGVACNAAAPDDKTSQDPLAQTPRDVQIARIFTRVLEQRHVNRHKLGTEDSQRAFELFFKAIDPTKLYFNEQDVDEFSKKYASNFAVLAKEGNLHAAFEIYNRYLQRVDERCAIAQKLLDENNFDFTVDEVFERDKKTAKYPASDEEVLDRMRKRIKFEILSLEAENRDKQKEAEAEKKDGDAESAAETADLRPEDPISKLKRRYSTLYKRLHQTSNDDLIEIYLTSISNSFDPHSTYMSPKSYENFMITIGLNLEGIGATLQWDDGYTIVKRIIKGSPAEKQGELKIDDKIVGVGQGKDGEIEDVIDMKLTDVVEKIRGKGGTLVRLKVVSQDGKTKIIEIVREKVDLEDSAAQGAIFTVRPNAEGGFDVADYEGKPEQVADFKVGVIDLPSFYLDMKAKGSSEGRNVSGDVRKILDEFNQKGVGACIIDLRYNGGGSLPEAVKMTGLFIKTGTVVQTKPNELGLDSPRSLNDPDPGQVWTKPLVVLTSRLSASASEIFSGAIKDYRRGLVVGDETTHGKGSVQSMQELSQGVLSIMNMRNSAPNYGAIKLTIQGYYLPGGESPQLQGVKSDVILPQFTSALEDVAESDLDYPLSFPKIAPGVYPDFGLVDNAIVAAVREKSEARVKESKDFQEEINKINLYKESKLRKATPLNREKYFAELDKLNANKEETEKMEEKVNGESGVQRDYYLDEAISLTRDYSEIIAGRAAAANAAPVRVAVPAAVF